MGSLRGFSIPFRFLGYCWLRSGPCLDWRQWSGRKTSFRTIHLSVDIDSEPPDIRGQCSVEHYTLVADSRGCCIGMEEFMNDSNLGKGWCIVDVESLELLRPTNQQQLSPRWLRVEFCVSSSCLTHNTFCRALTPFSSRSYDRLRHFSCGCAMLLLLSKKKRKKFTTMNPVDKFEPYTFYDSDGCDYRKVL